MMGREDDDDSHGSRTGRFSLPHRGNTRVEVGEPIRLPDPAAARPWLCVVKLVGKEGVVPPALEEEGEGEGTLTSTLLVRTGRGTTPEEAQRDAMAQLSLLYGTPAGPPPSVVITKKPSEPPPSLEAGARKRGPFAWLGRLLGRGRS